MAVETFWPRRGFSEVRLATGAMRSIGSIQSVRLSAALAARLSSLAGPSNTMAESSGANERARAPSVLPIARAPEPSGASM